MRVVIRADASVRIGTGHVMRCATLAGELAKAGAEVHFVCRAHDGHLADWLADKSEFAVHRLQRSTDTPPEHEPSGLAHAAWLGNSWQNDVLDTLTAIYLLGEIDWLVVDHYALDKRWENALRPFVKKIFTIDDLADRAHDCELLLDQNLFPEPEKRYENLVPKSAHLLLGPRYALLRPEFATARAATSGPRYPVRNVLVFFGGSDPEGLTLKAVNVLKSVAQEHEFRADIVTGPVNPHKAAITQATSGLKNAVVHDRFVNMWELMARADLFIGAGGTTSWERCCLKLPAVIISTAENQNGFSAALAEDGVQIFLGHFSQVTDDKFRAAISSLLTNPALLTHLSRTAAGITDGNGVRRILDLLSPSKIALRPATESDCEIMYEWRNDPETRKYFFNPRSIGFAEHKEWFLDILSHDDKTILIGEEAGASVGVIRLDFNKDWAYVSIYINPRLHNRGLGTKLLNAASAWTVKKYPNIHRLRAEIMTENTASIKAFLKADYKPYSLIYEKELPHEP